jgi:fatty acid desaturase
MSDDTPARDLAIRRLHQKRGFQSMLVAYAVINVFLWVLWAITSTDKSGAPWPLWVTLGWGAGIALSAWSTFGQRPITEEEVQREMQRSGGTVDSKAA